MNKPARILIVDDNEINRDTLEGLCESLGHTSILAESGSEALHLIRLHSQPDLVLLDILMPEMNGYEVLQQIKNDTALRSIPVIMISVVDEMETIVQCIGAGADDYLIKPFNAILLKARINACLTRKRFDDQEKKFNMWLAESYQKLQKAEESRDTLFHMIVHDLNNPLSAIRGYADLLQVAAREEQLSRKFQDGIGGIRKAALQMTSLVKQILDVSCLEQGKMPMQTTQLNIAELGRKICSQFFDDVEKRNGNITCTSNLEKIFCEADKGLVSRILQNLITNAIKHTRHEQSPEIVLSVEQIAGDVVLTVGDNGPGIAADQQEKIFTKFYQIYSGSERKVKGLGLGLAFCKMAAETMSGSIRVESEEGKGARFVVALPIASSQ